MAKAFLLRLMETVLALAPFMVVGGLSSSPNDPLFMDQEPRGEWCPPCEIFFTKLEENKETGKLNQVIRVQERGEPKSGTGMIFDWATGALDETCKYLRRFYGRKSCVLDFRPALEKHGNQPIRLVARRMIFEPLLGAEDARCPCETIERVSVDLSRHDKHSLPVDRMECAFSHNGGIELAKNGGSRRKSACYFADGTQPESNDAIWRCMREANCDVTDDWLQLVVLRDPRPAVVSTYFHLKAHTKSKVGELDFFVSRQLPALCEWLAVRYILFCGFLRHQSIVFWYDAAMADPLDWYFRFLYSIGLQLPYQPVNEIAEAARANAFRFRNKPTDEHPGQDVRNSTGPRKFEDEVSPETLKAADNILRQWLPPLLLENLGVEPVEKNDLSSE